LEKRLVDSDFCNIKLLGRIVMELVLQRHIGVS